MHLEEFIPSMDTRHGSINAFSNIECELMPYFWIHCKLNPKDGGLVHIYAERAGPRSETEILHLCCREIQELSDAQALDGILLCRIVAFNYLKKQACDKLTPLHLHQSPRAIVAIKKNRTGLLQIANWNNEFCLESLQAIA